VKKLGTVLLVGVVSSLLVAPVRADAGERDRHGAWCAQRFDQTVRLRDEAFADRDLDALMAFYRADAVEVDPSGRTHLDRDAIETQIGYLFTIDFDAEFVELKRDVDCDTAVLVLDSTFHLRATGTSQHFVTAQTFTFDRGRWSIQLAANTMLPG
jgi:ketosteroid isomerase-like protein